MDLRVFFEHSIEAGFFELCHFKPGSTIIEATIVDEHEALATVLARHDKRQWRDSQGIFHPQRCSLTRLSTGKNGLLKNAIGGSLFGGVGLLPRGNIGTQRSEILDLIQSCRLPGSSLKASPSTESLEP